MSPIIKPILYAEDDENDAFLMNRAFSKLNLQHPLRIVTDGKLAISYLSGSSPYASRLENPLPCLMLLDLSMPGKTGLDVLEWKQAQSSLSALPAIVFTSSNQLTDVQRAKTLGAHGYLIKPGDPNELIRVVKSVADYWLSTPRPAGEAPGAFVDVARIGLPAPDASF